MQEGDTAHPRSPTSQAGEPPGPQDRSRGTCVSPLPRAGYRICGPGAQSKRGSTFLFPSIPRPVMVAFVCSTKSRSLVQGYLRGQHRTSQTRAQGGRGASPGEGGSWDHVRPSCPLHSHSPSRQTCLPNGRFKDKKPHGPHNGDCRALRVQRRALLCAEPCAQAGLQAFAGWSRGGRS